MYVVHACFVHTCFQLSAPFVAPIKFNQFARTTYLCIYMQKCILWFTYLLADPYNDITRAHSITASCSSSHPALPFPAIQLTASIRAREMRPRRIQNLSIPDPDQPPQLNSSRHSILMVLGIKNEIT